MWGGISGFDDEGSTKIKLRGSEKFYILTPPKLISWLNSSVKYSTKIPILYVSSGSGGNIPVVNLDPIMIGNVKAAMVFPANAVTDNAFQSTKSTSDNLR